MNHPEILQGIYASRVPQHAAGMYPDQMTPVGRGQREITKSETAAVAMMMAELLAEMRKPKKNYITITDLEKAQDTKATIQAPVTRKRAM
jgi:hypothetical protein